MAVCSDSLDVYLANHYSLPIATQPAHGGRTLEIPEDIRAAAAGLARAVRLEGAHVDEQPNVWGNARDAQPASAYLPTPPCAADAPWFRVEASWPGGGWRFTLRFNDKHAAY